MDRINPAGLYCAYLRKSRRDEEMEALGQGETLQRHEKQLAALADRLGIRIARTYREIVSGDTIAQRPQVRQLLEDITAGLWDGVLVMDVDRLSRGDSIDQGVIMQTFLYAGALIVTPDKIYDPANDSDAEFFEMRLFFGRREYNIIKKRLQRGRNQSALDGCYLGSRDVYGYRRVKLQGRKGWTLEIIPEQADVVRSIFAWYADGMDGQPVGTYLIADRLNQIGLPSDRGGPWIPSTVRHMLTNPVYAGMIRWNHRTTQYRIVDGKREKTRPLNDREILVDGLHPAIIDRELFQRVQRMMDAHEKRPKSAQRDFANPFGGLVICPHCGHRMQTKGSPGRKGDFIYCPTQRCPTRSAYVFAVEDMTLQALGGWLADFQARQDDADAPHQDADAPARAVALSHHREQLATLEAQSGRLYDLLEQGLYTPAEYKQRRAELNAKIDAERAAIDALNAPATADPIAPLIPQIRTVVEAYRNAPTPAAKNALLRTVIDHIEYHKTQRCLRNNKPGDYLTLVIYPKYPDTPGDSGNP